MESGAKVSPHPFVSGLGGPMAAESAAGRSRLINADIDHRVPPPGTAVRHDTKFTDSRSEGMAWREHL
jgi:hypothetical protein